MAVGNEYTTSGKVEASVEVETNRRLDHIYEDLDNYSYVDMSFHTQKKLANESMYADLTQKSSRFLGMSCASGIKRPLIIIAALTLVGIVIIVAVIMAVLATQSMDCFHF